MTVDRIDSPRRVGSMIALATWLTVGLVVGCAGDPPEVSTDDPALLQGRELYADRCVTCHGATGGGGTGPRLNQGEVVEKYPDAADQAAIIRGGRNAMPAFGGLSDAELDAVVRYTREVIAEEE